jgi:hypothetical protein
MGELITVHEHWGNYAGTSKIGKLYPSGLLIICEPYVESEEADENACDFGTDSDGQA